MESESPTTARAAGRPWGKLAVATIALIPVSAIGLIGSLVVAGDATEEKASASEKVFGDWLGLSWLLCLFVGVFAWIWGRRTGQRHTKVAGRMALAYVVLAFLVLLIATYGQGTR